MTETGTQEVGAMGFWHRYRLLIIVAAILVAWLFVSREMAVREAEGRAAAQRAELVQQLDGRQSAMLKQSLTQFSVPLAWAIRRELMAENLEQVDQYLTELVE